MNFEEKSVVLIISTQRSGSTYLFDLLRYHPEVAFLRSAIVFKEFGFFGNRYPVDLTSATPFEGSSDFELYWRLRRRGIAGLDMKLTDLFGPSRTKRRYIKATSGSEDGRGWLVEKCHPEFYDFDTEKFLDRLIDVSSMVKTIKLVLNARSPISAIGSHLAYQERNKNWYADFSGSAVFTLLERSLESMAQIANETVIDYVDYNEINTSTHGCISALYESLELEADHDLVAAQAIAANMRSRQNSKKFFGEIQGSDEYYLDKYSTIFAENRLVLERLVSLHSTLVGIAASSGARSKRV